MEEAKRISIHMAASNHAAFMPTCVAALDAQSEQDFQVVVVDNGAHDGAGAWLREHRPDVIVIRNARPQPFAKSHDQAITFALSRWPAEVHRDRYILFLKPDVILPPEALARMRRAMDGDTALAAIGPQIFLATSEGGEEGEPQEIAYTETVVSTGLWMNKLRMWSTCREGTVPSTLFSPTVECLLVRASALVAIHEADGYLETDLDETATFVDLVWRLRLLGGNVATLSDVRAWRRLGSLEGMQSQKKGAHEARQSRRVRRQGLIDHMLVSAKNDFTSNRWVHGLWLFLDKMRFLVHLLIDLRLWAGLGKVVGARMRFAKKRKAFLAQVKVTPKEVRTWFV